MERSHLLATTVSKSRLVTEKEAQMFGRAATWMLGLALVAGLPAGAALAADLDEVTLKRDDGYSEIVAAEDDDLGRGDFTGGDTGNTGGGDSSGVDSNDATGSGYSAVSRDGEFSQGDNTRDWTRDGAGDRKRDWSGGQTNDGSRNDTR
jgi:hypothetical protein